MIPVAFLILSGLALPVCIIAIVFNFVMNKINDKMDENYLKNKQIERDLYEQK